MGNQIDIPISANIQTLQKQLDVLGQKLDKINRTKWQPVDPGSVERDARRVESILTSTTRRIRDRGGAIAAGVEERPAAADGGGGAGRVSRGIRRRWYNPVEYGEIPQSFVGGMGNGLGQITGAATRGAVQGAASGGGIMGGLGGLLRGTMIGAIAYSAFKVGSAVSEGTDMARDRAQTLDTLKRQMGDVGVSFERLKVASESAAYGLGMNSKDFAAFESRLNVASRGADRTPVELGESANVVGGFARAYGMDPNSAASMFGGMRNVNPRQSYREFAIILAETIEKSSMAARSDEVAQALVSFSMTASRLSLAVPNVSAYGGAYSSLMSSGIAGMTPEAASAILGQAGNAMTNMGAAGEAGQALTLAAFQHSGTHMNPLEASAEAGGGLFGTRASVFGADSAMGHLLGPAAKRLASGKGSHLTNFEMIRSQIQRVAGGSGPESLELQAEMLQRYFGLQSINQAAALMTMNTHDFGQMGNALDRAGIGLDKINYSSLQTVGKISGATTSSGLDAIYADMRTRTGTSALNDADISKIENARKGGNIDSYRSALIQASSTRDYAQDSYTVLRDSKVVLDDIKIGIGDHLYGKLTDIQADLVTMLGGKKKLDEGRKVDAAYMNDFNAEFHYQEGLSALNFHHQAQGARILDMPLDKQFAAGRTENAEYYKQLSLLERTRQHEKDQIFRDPQLEREIHVHVYLDKNGRVTETKLSDYNIPIPRGAGVH